MSNQENDMLREFQESVLTKKQTDRLVCIEPSHSWLKRWDSEGPLVVQAGYKVDPVGRFIKDASNPYVRLDGQARSWGAEACLGDHQSCLYTRKDRDPRQTFAALLRPSDDGRDLHVCVSHWDEGTAQAIGTALKGSYRALVNGVEINCNVTTSYHLLEDEGTYLAVKGQLKPGRTLLIGSGHGTSQEWLVDEQGRITGKPTQNLAVSNLAKAIAATPEVRSHALHLGEQTVNLAAIAAGLRSGKFGSMPTDIWGVVVARCVETWYQGFTAYLLAEHGSNLQSISNVVISGGGGELLRDRLVGFAIVPPDCQMASVQGAYEHFAIKTGVA
jgi:hypothetical protein